MKVIKTSGMKLFMPPNNTVLINITVCLNVKVSGPGIPSADETFFYILQFKGKTS